MNETNATQAAGSSAPAGSALDAAYALFCKRANQENRCWHGDIVRENLAGYIRTGSTPEQAVEQLFQWVARVESR